MVVTFGYATYLIRIACAIAVGYQLNDMIRDYKKGKAAKKVIDKRYEQLKEEKKV